MCGGVLSFAFYFEFALPYLLTPTRGQSLIAAVLALAACPLALWLSIWRVSWLAGDLLWWHRPIVALCLSYLIVAIAQLTRRNGHLYRSLLSLIFAYAAATTIAPAIRIGQEAVAFVC